MYAIIKIKETCDYAKEKGKYITVNNVRKKTGIKDHSDGTMNRYINNAPLNEIQNAIYCNIGNYPARLLLFSGGNLENDTYIEYISYYIMNICDEETIKIDNKIYLTEHIRNAFAHGRWFIDCEHNLVLCDAKNGKYNDYNFYWKEKINILDLLNVVYQKQVNNENKRALIRN